MAVSEKPGKGNRIFISTVSGEFEKASAAFSGLRSKLRRHLTAADCEVKVQEDFRQTSGGTLEKLDAYIRHCDAVIHLVGKMPGHLADADSPQDVIDYLAHIAAEPGGRTFLDKQPELLAEFGAGTGISLSQFEAYMALHHRVPLFVYATPDAASGQQAHLNRLLKVHPRKHASPFTDAADLLGQLIGDLRDIISALSPTEQRLAPTRLVSRHTGPESIGEFLGREDELKLLDDAWATPGTNVLSIIAWGGVGKTALLAEWIDRRFAQHAWKNDADQPDPLIYFDWTFYDQGTRSDDATHAGAASVDSFFDTALRFFGDPEPNLPGKGGRLAGLIQKYCTLLVLDGLEPMQYPPNHPQAGQITDPDLHALLATLAQKNPGLCVLTSRQVLTGLRRVDRHDLDELPEAIAIRLLQKLGVIGTEEDLAAAVRDYYGHALSLIVLGRFLFVKGGDIRLRDTIRLERANERRPETTTRNAWYVLEAYEQWLASPDGRPEDVQALRLTGLFDRPASPDCLDALRRAPAIPGLTDHLVPLDDDAWNAVLHRLHEANLIQLRYPPREANNLAPRPEARQAPLDAHPLIREYFAKQLRDKHQAGYQEAHSRLFDHLCKKTDYRPDTLEGLQPLYQAVLHGCLAGRHQETLMPIYFDRINRRSTFYASKLLGAVGANLSAVSNFFDIKWSQICPALNPNEAANVIGEAAYYLRSIGRPREAIDPTIRAIDAVRATGNEFDEALQLGNLCELFLTLGRISDAVSAGLEAVLKADESRDRFRRSVERALLAGALHQGGNLKEANRLFFESAKFYQGVSNVRVLCSVPGALFRDLLLDPAERAFWITLWESSSLRGARVVFEVAGRRVSLRKAELLHACERVYDEASAAYTVAISSKRHMQIGLDLNSLVRSRLIEKALGKMNGATERLISGLMTDALWHLRQGGVIEKVCPALLTASLHYHRIMGDEEKARGCLDEAQQIAERGPMPLYLADVHLHRARLFHDKAELKRARVLIEKHSYWRRKEELEDAEAASVNWKAPTS